MKKIADFVIRLKAQEQPETEVKHFWQQATPQERSQDLAIWTSQLAHSNISLSNKAFDRSSIYD